MLSYKHSLCFICFVFFFFRCSCRGFFCLQLPRYCFIAYASVCGCVVWHSPFCVHSPKIIFVTPTVVYQWGSGPPVVLYFLPHISQGMLENYGQAQTSLLLEVWDHVLAEAEKFYRRSMRDSQRAGWWWWQILWRKMWWAKKIKQLKSDQRDGKRKASF